MRNLLIMACGATKHDVGDRRVPPLQLYAGRQFTLAQTMLDNDWHVFVLSARYGLIQWHRPIATYDQLMTQPRAAELATDRLQLALFNCWTSPANRIVVYGGALYRSVVQAWATTRGTTPRPLQLITGRGCGDHYSQLKSISQEAAR